jgi:hypothetical protein
MSRLRHPVRAIREPFGTAGLIVACVALIAALGGSAIAAKGALTGKQKKEVTKIAKSFAGKDGAQGPAGPQGPQGTKGDNGAAGAKGADGTNGKDGTPGLPGTPGKAGESVNVFELSPGNGEGCDETGGAKFANATGVAFACNGEGGGGGGGWPETLPSGSTMTGAWEVQGEAGIVLGGIYAPTNIGFPIPLETAPEEIIVIYGTDSEAEKDKCPGDPFEPKAVTPGVLCLYANNSSIEPLTQTAGSASRYGATVFFDKTVQAFGTWSVIAG